MKYGTKLSKMLTVRNNSLRKRDLLFIKSSMWYYNTTRKKRGRIIDITMLLFHTDTYTQDSPCTHALASTHTQMHICVIAQSNAVNELYIYLCF